MDNLIRIIYFAAVIVYCLMVWAHRRTMKKVERLFTQEQEIKKMINIAMLRSIQEQAVQREDFEMAKKAQDMIEKWEKM